MALNSAIVGRALAVLSLTVSGCAYTAIPKMRGTVTDAMSDRPVGGALVRVSGRDRETVAVTTDEAGRFSVPGVIHFGLAPVPRLLPCIRLRLEAAGYRVQDVARVVAYDSDVGPPFELVPVSQASDARVEPVEEC